MGDTFAFLKRSSAPCARSSYGSGTLAFHDSYAHIRPCIDHQIVDSVHQVSRRSIPLQ